MSQVQTPTPNKAVSPSKTKSTGLFVLIGLLLMSGYSYLLISLTPLDMGRFTFQFFPIPVYTTFAEFLFLMLVTIVAMWHIKLALDNSQQSSRSKRLGRFGHWAFALVLISTPLIFRGAAEFLIQQLNYS